MPDDNAQAAPRLVTFGAADSTPACERPADPFVDAAKRDVPRVFAECPDWYEDGWGHVHVMACRLVERLAVRGHFPAASKWAIHEMVTAGLFTTEIAFGSRLFENRQRYMKGGSLISTDKLLEGKQPLGSPSEGVAPRNKWIIDQYDAKGTDTYRKPTKVHAKWDGMRATERAAICPEAPGKIAKNTVTTIIKLERNRRRGVAPKKKAKRKRKLA
jgi:hypothetical protein